MRFKKIVAILLVCCMSLTLLAGCGGAGSGGTSTGASGAAAPAPAANDGVLDVGYSQTPDTLTPFRANTNRDAPYFKLVCESLAVFDSSRKIQPWVAKSWVTEDNGFSYDIEIHNTVSDSEGNKITAADIVWFIEKSKESALKPVFAKVDSVEQTGDYTLRVTLTSNIMGTIETILTDTFIISQTAFEASSDEFGTSLVATSPYKVTEFTASSILKLEKRDDYWQDEANLPEVVRPNVKAIAFHAISEASQMGIALETGTIDMSIKVDPSTGSQFVDNPAYNIELAEGNQGMQVFFSGADQSPVASDVKLRQAICYAIDTQGLITGLCAGYGTPMYDSHSPILIGFNEKWRNEGYYTYDVEKAKALVSESDYKGQTLTILAPSTSATSRLAQMMQSYLLQVGIKVELNLVDMALYTAIRLDGTKYDMVLNSIGGTYLSDAWAIRYDPAAYSTGDATSRRDMALAELLYKTWTPEGWTEANIDAVHNYLKDNAISYGMVNPQNMIIWRTDVGLEKEVREAAGYIAPAASTYTNF